MREVHGYPLQWPVAWPRTTEREWSRFGVTFAAARDHLLAQLALMGAADVVISSNVEFRRDGLPYANRPEPDDPGVAVYFVRDGRAQCIPVDRWRKVKDNIRAAGLTVEALRGLDRWGAKHLVDAAFAGFAALPESVGVVSDDWWVVLGVARDASPETIRQAYRRLAGEHHPDRGGDTERFIALRRAYDRAMASWR